MPLVPTALSGAGGWQRARRRGHPRFEMLSVDVVDDRTVRLIGRRGGAISYESTMVVAQDGNTMTETRTAAMPVGDAIMPIMTPLTGEVDGQRPVLFRMSAARVGSPTTGAHVLSGTWKVVELDLLNHDEDTTYRIVDDSVTMSDRMGRSYTARLEDRERRTTATPGSTACRCGGSTSGRSRSRTSAGTRSCR